VIPPWAVRLVLTAALLVFVYQGSRIALVVVLALVAIRCELTDYLRRRDTSAPKIKDRSL
jgi:hypothetical protein